jgi:hypothetical protein
MAPHAFVDESKTGGYWLAAAIVESRDLDQLRRVTRGFRLPRQRRVHFVTESDGRRKKILTRLTSAGASVLVYDASHCPNGISPRDMALERLVDDLAKMGARRLVLERDDSVFAADRKIIRDRAEIAGCLDTLLYEHLRAYEEPLLAIPDAVAWCCQKGGDWRARADPLISELISL